MNRDLPGGIREGAVVAGKYRIGPTLGGGAMGVVVSARHLLLNEDVAIKFLVADRWHQADAVERFLDEARAAVRIQSEHVVRVLDVAILDGGAPYIVMELLRGRDLATRLRQGGPLPLAEAVDLLLQACDGVAASHRIGIVHRDIKPANLFLVEREGEGPTIKVLDFGISKGARLVTRTADVEGTLQSAHLTGADSVLGSPQYMSPEQMDSPRDADARADVWALGVTLFEVVTGVPPFRGTSLVQIYARMMSSEGREGWRAELAQVAPSLDAVVARCLAERREDRFATAEQLARALTEVSSGPAGALVARPSARSLSDSNSGVERAPPLTPRSDSGRAPAGRSLLVAVLGGFVGSAIFVWGARAKLGGEPARTESSLAAPASAAATLTRDPPPAIVRSPAPVVSADPPGVAEKTAADTPARAPSARHDLPAARVPSASATARIASAPTPSTEGAKPAPASSTFTPAQVNDLLRSRE